MVDSVLLFFRRMARLPLSTRYQVVYFALIILTGAALGYGGLTKGHDWGDDFASYIMQAKSITELAPASFLEANEITLRHLDMDKVGFPLSYPWGAPLLIAPFWALFGLDIQALKLPNLLCFVLFLITVIPLLRGYHTTGHLIFLVAFFSCNPLILSELNTIGSDFPFLCASTLSLLLIELTIIRGRRLITSAVDASLLGASVAIAVTVRTNGWLLLLPLVVAQLVAQGVIPRREAPASGPLSRTQLCLPYVWCGGILVLWNLIFPVSLSRFSAIPAWTFGKLAQNLAAYYLLPLQLLYATPLPWFFYLSFIAFGVIGAVTSCRKTPQFAIYTGASLGLYILWPFYQGIRFILPILPFLLHFVLEGIRTTGDQLPEARRRVFNGVVGMCGALSILFPLATSASKIAKNLHHHRAAPQGPYSPDAEEMFAFISSHTKPDDKIIFSKPRLMRLRTGRRSFERSHFGALEPGEYVCLYKAGVGGQGGWPFAERSADDVAWGKIIHRVFENKEFLVGKVIPRGTTAPP